MNLKNYLLNLIRTLKSFLISCLVFVIYKTLILTWRMKRLEPSQLKEDLKNNRPVVFALWHGDELAMIPFCRFYPIVTMTSISSDGQLIDRVVRWLGIKTSKGSSSRKAVQGLKGLIRIARAGRIPIVPVDGPRGPIYEPKPGVFELSKVLGARIYPGAIACSSKISFNKSWNKTFLPKLFSEVVLYWGEPLDAILKDENPRSPDLAQKLKLALNAAGQSARKEIAHLS